MQKQRRVGFNRWFSYWKVISLLQPVNPNFFYFLTKSCLNIPVRPVAGSISMAILLPKAVYLMYAKKIMGNTTSKNQYSGQAAPPCSFVQRFFMRCRDSTNTFLLTRKKLTFAGECN